MALDALGFSCAEDVLKKLLAMWLMPTVFALKYWDQKAGLPPAELKEISQAAATSVWAAVVADKDDIGRRYFEDCAIASTDDTPNPFADGVRSYALDADKARQLWAKSEAPCNHRR